MYYFEALFSGLLHIFAWPTFGLMLVGIAVGFVVGILPGLGGITTMALMLPFIYTMTPVEAFAFLLGMHSVTATTGDITSILFGVPGEGSSAALVVDGHPMAKKGEAGRALGAALMSSLVGAVFGALVLAASVPIVRPLVLGLGPPELFMMVILGISFIGTLSGSSITKGILVGALGLLLSTVGMDPKMGWLRFTFDIAYLLEGINLVPAAIGLFAIPELVELAVKRTSIAEAGIVKVGGVLEGIKDTFRHWSLVLRCSAIGSLIGFMPGMGAGPAQWLAYGHAVHASELSGKGAIEGVLGPGAANNSKEGGALIPTLAFGIPGSPIMAILLAAFLIIGIVPGPAMLKEHLDITFSMVWVIVVSNVITVIISLMFLNQLVKLTLIKGTRLIPSILLLVFIGAFTSNNSLADLVVAMSFGALGIAMVWLDWPRPPLILGLVLGRLAEEYFWTSTALFGASWLWRPIVLVLIGLTALSIAYPFWQKRARASLNTSEVPPSNRNGELILNLLLFSLPAFAIYDTWTWPFAARLFPLIVSIAMIPLALICLLSKLIEKQDTIPDAKLFGDSGVSSSLARQRTTSMLLWIAGLFVGIWLFGFLISVGVFSFLYLKLEAREGWRCTLLLTAATWICLFALFDVVLHVPFPDGVVLRFFNF